MSLILFLLYYCYIKGNMCAGENGNKFKYLLMSLGSMNEKSINIKKRGIKT